VLRKVRDMEDEVLGVIAGCREDIRSVWEDRVVRDMLARRKVRLEDSAGLCVLFFRPSGYQTLTSVFQLPERCGPNRPHGLPNNGRRHT
jgi:guanine nucleotide-binding protein subunit alpha